jgi:hypothetical protein
MLQCKIARLIGAGDWVVTQCSDGNGSRSEIEPAAEASTAEATAAEASTEATPEASATEASTEVRRRKGRSNRR